MVQLAQTLRAMRDVQPLTPYLSAYTRHAPQFHQWLQQQTQAAPAAGAGDPWHKEFWNPPEFNSSWLEQYVVANEKGERTWAPNTPAEVIAKFDAYQAYNKEHMAKMARNPFEYFGPAIEKVATQKAQEIVRQALNQQREVEQNRSFIDQNGDWLYERNADGTRKMDSVFDPASGQWRHTPALSVWGNKFKGYVQEVSLTQQQRGYSDVDEQRRYATMMVQRDFAIALHKGEVKLAPATPPAAPAAPPVNPQLAGNDDFLRRNNAPQVPPTIPPTNGNSRFQEPPLPATAAELSAALMKSLKEAGVG